MDPMDQLRTLFTVKGLHPVTGQLVEVALPAKTHIEAKQQAEAMGLKGVLVLRLPVKPKIPRPRRRRV